jgi:endonuclease YncB( thermonuclease family)
MRDNEVREAYVTRVVDGDTFEAIVDLKYGTSRTVTFRLLGVDTAERKDKVPYQKAKEFTAEHILNKTIHIHTPKDKHDSFGRYLCNVYLDEEGNEVTLNEMLLIEELAKKYKK